MTPTEKGRRFDALYHGESNRSLATMVVNRESDLEELKAENATLRQQLADVTESMGRVEERCAKLRELVRTLANCAAGHGCDYCPINGGHGYIGETDMCESVHDCMRELGIEVEG